MFGWTNLKKRNTSFYGSLFALFESNKSSFEITSTVPWHPVSLLHVSREMEF